MELDFSFLDNIATGKRDISPNKSITAQGEQIDAQDAKMPGKGRETPQTTDKAEERDEDQERACFKGVYSWEEDSTEDAPGDEIRPLTAPGEEIDAQDVTGANTGYKEPVDYEQIAFMRLEREQSAIERAKAIYNEYQESIKRSEDLRTTIARGARDGEEAETLLLQAVECIALLTGDQAFKASVTGYMQDRSRIPF